MNQEHLIETWYDWGLGPCAANCLLSLALDVSTELAITWLTHAVRLREAKFRRPIRRISVQTFCREHSVTAEHVVDAIDRIYADDYEAALRFLSEPRGD